MKKLVRVKFYRKAVLEISLIFHLSCFCKFLCNQKIQDTGMRNNNYVRYFTSNVAMFFQKSPKSAFKLIDPDSKLMVFFSFTIGQHLKQELFAPTCVLFDLFLAYLSGFLQNFQHPSVLDARKGTKVKVRKLRFQLSDTRTHRPRRIQSAA